MENFELVMPKMGESVTEATITRWIKNEGDVVEADEVVLEIATDKVDSDIQASHAGVLIKQNFKEGDIIKVGDVIALISNDKNTLDSDDKPLVAETKPTKSVHRKNGDVKTFYSPLVRSIAQKEGVSLSELEHLTGTGTSGRITKIDIKAYLSNRKENNKNNVANVPAQTATQAVKVMGIPHNTVLVQRPAVTIMAGDEITEMDRMRKMISDHMVMSKHVSPHVTAFVEADVTGLVLWRAKVKDTFEKREGEKLTYMPAVIEASVKAIRDYPLINVSVDQSGTNIIKHKLVNIGMATALPTGNLIVPVIKNANEKNLLGLVKSVNDLAAKARDNRLVPDDVQGGTFTISNVGSFGNIMGTPIINQPQVAILAVGIIKKKPAVVETPQGDVIEVRHFMYLSLSFDHRVVDGSLGGAFVKRIADYLENWDINRAI